MKVLLLGSGGRESALAWALNASPSVAELIAAPGNPGISAYAETVPVEPIDTRAVVDLARHLAADLVVVGPEAPLAVGVSDALRAEGILVFGPDAAAARIEASKTHAKDLMRAAGIPTADATTFTVVDEAVAHLRRVEPPYVIKADGLAAGKGVVVTQSLAEAEEAVAERLVEQRFGTAGSSVLIEDFLDGEELSLIAFCDGKTAVPCEPAQDYKRIFDGDRGPNTGGMGSYSPVPACPPDLAAEITHDVIEPMLAETARRGAPFVGALYAGLALTSRGPRVIEFNARFGDPETQALLPRLESDLGAVCHAAAAGDLSGTELRWSPDASVCVVLAASGYPDGPRVGDEISGLEEASATRGVHLFHAGTRSQDGRVLTAGGRVLAVTARGESFADARRLAYEAAGKITFDGKHVRTDIALRAEEARHAGALS